jgi:hypothetical protein
MSATAENISTTTSKKRKRSPKPKHTKTKKTKKLRKPKYKGPDAVPADPERSVPNSLRRYLVKIDVAKGQSRKLEDLSITYCSKKDMVHGIQKTLGGSFQMLTTTTGPHGDLMVYVDEEGVLKKLDYNTSILDAVQFERLGQPSSMPLRAFGPAVIAPDKGFTLKQAQDLWTHLRKYTFKYAK